MASSGSMYTSFARHRLVFEWNIASQNVANNTSIITGKLFLQSMDSTGQVWMTNVNSGSMQINSTKKTFNATSTLNPNQKKLLFASNFTIPHDANGNGSFTMASTFNVNFVFYGVSYFNINVSGKATLNTIPRTSDVSVSKGTINMGDSVKINIARKSSSFRHTLRFLFGNDTVTIADKTTNTTVPFTPPDWLLRQMPNKTSLWGRVVCDTYSGNTKIGTKTVNMTINTINNANYQPEIKDIIIKEEDTSITTAVGAVFLQGKSRFNVKVISSSKRYSNIARTEFLFGQQHFYSDTFSGISTSESGTLDVKATVWDTRGYSATKTVQINVFPYKNPQVSKFSVVRRQNAQEIVDINFTGKTTPVGTDNTMGYKLEYNSAKNTTWIPIKAEKNATKNTWTLSMSKDGIEIDQSYNFRLTVYDEMMNAVSTQIVTVALVPMSWGSHGSSIGKVFEEGKEEFQVFGEIAVNGVKLRDVFYPVGSIYQSTASTNPSEFIGGTWERYAKGRVLIGVNDGGGKDGLGASDRNGGSRNPLTAHRHNIRMVAGNGRKNKSTTKYGIWYSHRDDWNYVNMEQIPDDGGTASNDAQQTAMVAKSTGQSAEYLNYQEYTTVYTFRRIG